MFKSSWPDLTKELRDHIEKTGEASYGLDKAKSTTERKALADYMKGPNLGFLCVHVDHVRGLLQRNPILIVR
jgi:hypothetical protein